ncbi:OmpA family protein [Pigmentiphaga aceris]|uniref:OmpA family protein n=1 Tax=Pigmentiphaga aceris TaxID=1940612 RepID=UPI001FE7EB75|nr:OmpA family protein [Pigmentiphaga aceris]
MSQDQIELLKDQGFALKEEGWTFDISSKVLFETDSLHLTPASRPALERVGKALMRVGINRLRLEGHTDSQGNVDYNRRLSVARAQSVAEALIAVGINRDHITARGLGMSRPVADNRTAAGRAENRRVAIIVASE